MVVKIRPSSRGWGHSSDRLTMGAIRPDLRGMVARSSERYCPKSAGEDMVVLEG